MTLSRMEAGDGRSRGGRVGPGGFTRRGGDRLREKDNRREEGDRRHSRRPRSAWVSMRDLLGPWRRSLVGRLFCCCGVFDVEDKG
ncbi:hypothetical protein RJT34_15863 [Clitoria ternatea]|uniref:Uncharacterized protein n=1 Tax=Clitoria ternatea TaxID=43366 RepID=A0AAN9J6D9_CLITE